MSDNPLKQYFRRPVLYIKLPSKGAYYSSDVFQATETGDIPVYPMTAIDEITGKTPDAVFNGQAVVDIIQSCVPAIKDGWKINTIDLESILIAIRVASNGEKMSIGSKCPSCETDGDYEVDLLDLLNNKTVPNYNKELNLNELLIKFRPITWAESTKNSMAQFDLQKLMVMLQDYEDTDAKQQELKKVFTKLNETVTNLVVDTIECIKTPESIVTNKNHILEFMQNCDKSTSQTIRDYSIDLKTQGDLKPLQIRCFNCQHEYKQKLNLNITDFFD